ncbi:hypothetical protein ACROYT_G025810 [Oculina patagonica]
MSLLKMPLEQLNPHIMCVLCAGYLVDATTIIECLHSFCRSCIVKYLQTSYHCPVCDAEVHKTKPLLHIRPDRPLQDIVNKLVPGLVYDELSRRKEFEEKEEKENTTNNDETEKVNTETQAKNSAEVKMDDPIFITLEYYRRKRNWNERQIFPTRYLRCPSAVTVNVLKKFLVMKFAIPDTQQAELVRSDELLDDSLTMKEVSQIYGLYSKSFLDLQYSFLDACDKDTKTSKESVGEAPQKKLKTCKEEKSETKENESCAVIKTEPIDVEEKEKLPELPECASNAEQHFQTCADISPTFPETPPSFEIDPGEQELALV